MKLNVFEIVLLFVFGILAVGAVFVFSKIRGNQDSGEFSTVEVWGTLQPYLIDPVLEQAYGDRNFNYEVNYTYKTIDEFRTDFVNELANRRGPDLVLLPHEEIISQSEKLITVPYGSYNNTNYEVSRSIYESRYIKSSDIFLNDTGVLATPFLADPIVLFYNENLESLLDKKFIPRTWNELINDEDSFSKIISLNGRSIDRALISLGGSRTNNVKELLSLLFLQAGADLITKDRRGNYEVSIDGKAEQEALAFYTQFSDPRKKVYTWNDSFTDPFDLFVKNRLLFYPDFSSRYVDISLANPNIDFSVAQIPQLNDRDENSTFVRIYGFAVPTSANNIAQSFRTAGILSFLTTTEEVIPNLSLSSAIRAPLPNSTPLYKKIFNDSAIIGKLWIDKFPDQTSDSFERAVRSVVSEGKSTFDSLNRAKKELEVIYK